MNSTTASDGNVKGEKMLCLAFNQDNSCFMGGTEGGFFTYNTEPFAQGTRRSLDGIGVVELLYRSNILALVGGGSCPQWPVNKVILWDDTKRKGIGELSFHTPVKAVKMRKDIIVAVLEKKVYLYNFADLQIRQFFETISNPAGLCALSLEPQSKRVLAYPAEQKGTVRLELLDGTDVKKTVLIPAHESQLGALSLNRDGSLLASASERGTLIRVFQTGSGELLTELRRGADRAIIYSLCFNASSTLLACTSDKCTVHIFTVLEQEVDQENQEGQEQTTVEEPSSAYSRLPRNLFNIAGQAQNALQDQIGNYLPKYFTTETRRSVVKIPTQEAIMICAFGSKPNTISVAGMDGSFSQFAFDVSSGASERTFFGSI